MMANHYVYAPTTGEIILVVKGNRKHAESNVNSGVIVSMEKPAYIKHESHYHKDGKIVDRPTITIPKTAKVGVATIIRGLSAKAKFEVAGDIGAMRGTNLDLLFNVEGEYEVTVFPEFPYVTTKAVIKVLP